MLTDRGRDLRGLRMGAALSGLGKWRAAAGATPVVYLLRDEFTDTRAAGAVNGTPATPGPGTRVVVDTGGDEISVLGGRCIISNPNSAWDAGIWYESFARIAGRLCLWSVNLDLPPAKYISLGFDNDQFDQVDQNGFYFQAGPDIDVYDSTVSKPPWQWSNGVWYTCCVVLRSAGQFFLIKGGAFSSFILGWIGKNNLTDPLYPGLCNFDQTGLLDYVRIPDVLWAPTPLVSDSFDRGNGAIGTSDGAGTEETAQSTPAWESGGATWTIAANEAINTPTEGAEQVINGDMELDSDWVDYLTPTTNERSAAQAHSGTFSRHVVGDSNNDGIAQTGLEALLGQWYILQCWAYGVSGLGRLQSAGVNLPGSAQTGVSGSWIFLFFTSRCILASINNTITMLIPGVAGGEWYFDDASYKQLTLNTLFSNLQTSEDDFIATVELDTVVAGSQAGMVLCLDDADSPANFVIAYHDGTNCKLEKCVAGVYTTVISAAAAYAADAELRVVKQGTSFALYYNNAKVGSTSTVSDAGIISNTKHGLFSTYAGNQFDNFYVFARGTNGEYAALDAW